MDFSKIDLKDNQEVARFIIERAAKESFKNRSDFEKFRNRLIKEKKAVIFHNLYFIRAYNDLLKEGRISENKELLKLIQKRGVRTLSGVAPVTVLTKPFPCPGRCIYCPTDVRMPKSYLPSQPAAQRAFRQRFNPYTQVFVRLRAMSMTGHEVSKVELRIIGGTFSSYPKRYRKWFIKQCLLAMNEFSELMKESRFDDMKNLIKEEEVQSEYGNEKVNTVILKALNGRKSFDDVIKENEGGQVRCIGINIETRPDFISKNEIRYLRKLGVTKVEMGVQTTDEKVQKLTKRGHDLEAVKKATALLKDAGFKISYHMMPNLPGADEKSDSAMMRELFNDEAYQPDYLKIYPCVVMPKTELSDMFKKGLFHAYDDETLERVLLENLRAVPEYCRVDRIARDIPSTEIESGFRVSNIRQILEAKLLKDGFAVREIRSKEIKDESADLKDIVFMERIYQASGGVEYFLSYEDIVNNKLIALLRLRFPGKTFLKELKDAALIREVHVYGRQISVGSKSNQKQHSGWGTKLLEKAEIIAKSGGYKRIAVISGIGTRRYYEKFGYSLGSSYMVKEL